MEYSEGQRHRREGRRGKGEVYRPTRQKMQKGMMCACVCNTSDSVRAYHMGLVLPSIFRIGGDDGVARSTRVAGLQWVQGGEHTQ